MEVWYPGAKRTLTFDGCGPHLTGLWKGVLHTTEGSSLAGALGAYRTTHNYPHFTVDASTIEQQCPIDQGATALEHPAGTPETNRGHAVQIELVEFAQNAGNFSPELLANLARLMRWIENTVGMPWNAAIFSVPAQRMTNAVWGSFSGWCGHQHVPNNSHWDPGAFPISKLAPASAPELKVKPMYDPALTLEPVVASLNKNGGTYLVAASGAVYAFGVPYKGGANGQAYFKGRQAARIEEPNDAERAAGRTYTIIDTADERYAF